MMICLQWLSAVLRTVFEQESCRIWDIFFYCFGLYVVLLWTSVVSMTLHRWCFFVRLPCCFEALRPQRFWPPPSIAHSVIYHSSLWSAWSPRLPLLFTIYSTLVCTAFVCVFVLVPSHLEFDPQEAWPVHSHITGYFNDKNLHLMKQSSQVRLHKTCF